TIPRGTPTTVPTPLPRTLTGKKQIVWKVESSAKDGVARVPTRVVATNKGKAIFLSMQFSIYLVRIDQQTGPSGPRPHQLYPFSSIGPVLLDRYFAECMQKP